MSRRLRRRGQRNPGGFFGGRPLAVPHHRTKFRPGKDPFEIENKSKEMRPLPLPTKMLEAEAFHKRRAAFRNKSFSGLPGSAALGAAAKKKDIDVLDEVWQRFRADSIVKGLDARVRDQYVRDFWCWLRGKGDPAEHKRTPWGHQDYAKISTEVSSYMGALLDKSHDFQKKVALLNTKARLRQLTLNELWLYYKYIIKGGFHDLTQNDFLADWNWAHPSANAPDASLRNEDGNVTMFTRRTDKFPGSNRVRIKAQEEVVSADDYRKALRDTECSGAKAADLAETERENGRALPSEAALDAIAEEEENEKDEEEEDGQQDMDIDEGKGKGKAEEEEEEEDEPRLRGPRRLRRGGPTPSTSAARDRPDEPTPAGAAVARRDIQPEEVVEVEAERERPKISLGPTQVLGSEERASLVKELGKIQEEARQKDEEIKKLTAAKLSTTEVVSNVKRINQRLEGQVRKLEAELEERTQDIGRLGEIRGQELGLAQKKIDEMRAKTDEQRRERESAAERLDAAEVKLQQDQKRIETLKQEVETRESQLTKVNAKVEQREQDLKANKNKISKLVKTIDAQRNKVSTAETQLGKAKQEIERLKRERDNAKKQGDAALTRVKEDALREQNKLKTASERKIRAAEKKISDNEGTIRAFKQSIETTKRERENVDAELRRLKDDKRSLEDRLNAAEGGLTQARIRIGTLRGEVSGLAESLKQREESLEAALATQFEQGRTITQGKQLFEQGKRQLEEQREVINRLNELAQRQGAELSRLRALPQTTEEQQQRIRVLERAGREATAGLRRANIDRQVLEERVAAAEEGFIQRGVRLKVLVEEVNKREARIRSLLQQLQSAGQGVDGKLDSLKRERLSGENNVLRSELLKAKQQLAQMQAALRVEREINRFHSDVGRTAGPTPSTSAALPRPTPQTTFGITPPTTSRRPGPKRRPGARSRRPRP